MWKGIKMADKKRLIDANSLVKDFELLAKYEEGSLQSTILGVTHTIKARPTIDAVEVRHGYWIEKGYVCGETEYECSKCKETEWRTSISRFKYCPFCGAYMDKKINI